MVAFDHCTGLWSRLKGGLRPLFGLQTAGQSDENQRQSRFQVEPLEPRILLSGDPVAGELARLVDDATHAMFVNDHAAVVEQLKTDIVADAGHADHDSQGVVVSGSQVGDERGVEWPSEWTGPPVAVPASVVEVKTPNSALSADMVGAATAEVAPVTPAGDQVGVAALSDTYSARGPPAATLVTVAEVETLSSALAADIIMGAATAVVVPSTPAGDQVGVAPLSDSYFARGPPVATLATVAELETANSALAADTLDGATAVVVPSVRAGDQVGVAPVSDVYSARGPPSADYLLADASSPLASAPAALSTADLQSSAGLALAIWSDALAAHGLSLPTGAPTLLRRRTVSLGDRVGTVVELLATGLHHDRFQEAATSVATELAGVFGCERVSIGFLNRQHVRLAALSNSAAFGKRANLVRAIEFAMEEAIDQQAIIVIPATDGQEHVVRAHEALSREHGQNAVCTVPLTEDNRVLGAITLERPADNPFDPANIQLCEHVGVLLGPVLELKRREDRWIGRKALDSLGAVLLRLLGPRHVALKLGAIAAAATVAFLWFAKGDYRVTADASLEGKIQRALAAPVAGYLSEAQSRAATWLRPASSWPRSMIAICGSNG